MASSSSSEVCTVINPADCDLDVKLGPDKLTGSALTLGQFAYCWSGARGNIGITGGKYCFGCTIVCDQLVMMEGTPLDQQHVSRVGISRGNTPVGCLGETNRSFGYDGNGRFFNAGIDVVYGETFGKGDTIVCLVNLERKPLGLVEFSKNGKRLGPEAILVTESPAGKLPWDSALFPHVLLKNTVVKFQFNTKQGLVPEEGYKPWDLAMKDGNAIKGPVLSNFKDCEVIMMVGLPGSGKTTWAEKWVKAHPEKRYILLGTDLALDRMKVPSSLRIFNNDKDYDRLMVRVAAMINILCSLAAKLPRNYIIDDWNCYKDSRSKRLEHFASFHKFAVVVFPGLLELMARAEKRSKEIGKELLLEDVYRMLVTFSFPMSKKMPETDEDFDEVIFTDLKRTDAEQHLGEMKRDLFLHIMNSGTGHSRTDQSEPGVQVVPANVNRGYARIGEPSVIGSMLPYSNNLNRGHTEAVRPVALSSTQLFPNNVNTIPESFEHHFPLGSLNPMPPTYRYPGTYSTYSNPIRGEIRGYPRRYSNFRGPVLGNNLAQYGGSLHDSVGTHEPRSDYRPTYVSQHGPPNPMPQRSNPADGQHRGTAPYRPPGPGF